MPRSVNWVPDIGTCQLRVSALSAAGEVVQGSESADFELLMLHSLDISRSVRWAQT